MQSFSVYCLLLCSMIIFAAHQINAMETEDRLVTEVPSKVDFEHTTVKTWPLPEKVHEKRGSIAAAAVSGSGSRRPARVRVNRPSNIQCANGVVTITDGQITCGK
ncbi:unnamed protein product [Adineta ricciae]|uniref:Uncharacterized protein n=1 Tax=Adineta ricciae TaxID=249248 RepID=A0A814QYE6_ADIRI|nr:unnamed protein product [Adineta ricciae]CAF1125978.1 unnamed protein product [Adineta ricciae]